MKLRYSALLAAIGLIAAAHTAAAQVLAPEPNIGSLTHVPAFTQPARTMVRTDSFPTRPKLTLNVADGTKSQIAIVKPLQMNRPCYSVRSYNYTADPESPQRTGATTCTVAKADGARYALAPGTRVVGSFPK